MDTMLKGAAIAAIATAVSVLPVQARIACKDGYQRVQGNEIATPYCQDEYFAAVARDHGFNVSGNAIRGSYTLKEEVCRYISADIRVSDQCPSNSDSGRRQ